MALRRNARIPLRRETMALRKHRAALARARQGPDGKWETNKKKREVRTVRKMCAKITTSFAVARTQRLADEADALVSYKRLVTKLKKIEKWPALQDLLPKLQILAVSAKLLKKKPSLVEAFTAAAKRCRKSKDAAVAHLLSSWNEASRDKQDQNSARVVPPGSAPATDFSVNAVSFTSSAATLPPSPRPLKPSRPLKVLRTRKLGRMFATMREQRANEEPDMIALSKQLASELATCCNAKSLRLLFPRLNGLVVTGRVLQQSPSVLDTLVAAAKRCRKSRDATVVQLVSTWRKVLTQQEEQEELRTFMPKDNTQCEVDVISSDSEHVKSFSSQAEQPPDVSLLLPLKQTLPPAHTKQSKITAFLSNSGG